MKLCRLRTIGLSVILLYAVATRAQFVEDFSDGDYTSEPVWSGIYANFAVNPWKQLQTKAQQASYSWLVTPCRVNHRAEWTFWCRVATVPTAYNWLRFYLISDAENPQYGNGWYVQVGGANKNITLDRQTHGNIETLIENETRKQLIAQEDNKLFVRVTLDENGVFELYSQVVGVDVDYVAEGMYKALYVGESGWCGLLVRNTSQTGGCYYVDDIRVTGEYSAPQEFFVPEHGDLIINEIMYEPAVDGQEYVEIYNRSDVCLQLSDVGITTRNAVGELQKANVFPSFSSVKPYGYVVLCDNADLLSAFHQSPDSVMFYGCAWSRKLPNAGTTLFLVNTLTSEILDSAVYSPAFHHPLLVASKGVALERIHPDLSGTLSSSWHSASAESGYATPGRINSQYRDIYADGNGDNNRFVWLAQDCFSPNGDGYEDVCLIHYLLPSEGFTANVTVFTPKGLPVYTLPANGILATEGTLLWDGKTTEGKVVSVGVYVLMCEFTNVRTGQSLRHRLPVAVAAR